jgi:hypothetical protein
MIQIAEIIRRHLGWCPNTRALKNQAGTISFRPADSPKVPADPGTTPASPGFPLYRHTQFGTIQIWATLAAVAVILLSVVLFGGIWIPCIVAAFLLIALGLFGSLTVMVHQDHVLLRFGFFGIIRKSFPLGNITSVTKVKNPWYYGWGIRWTPDGPLYNISGEEGVMLVLADGKKVRIGSDEPEALADAIRRALG